MSRREWGPNRQVENGRGGSSSRGFKSWVLGLIVPSVFDIDHEQRL